MIIGLIGLAGSGKDTAADFLVDKGFVKMAWADPIKRFAMEIFDFSEEQLWGPSEKRSEPDKRYPLSNGEFLTPREVLQKIGTEGGRAAYDSIWTNYTLRKAKEILTDPNISYDKLDGTYGSHHTVIVPGVVISDCRFMNECKAIQDAGGTIIKIVREKAGLTGARALHSSETEQRLIRQGDVDHVIYNNGSLEELNKKIIDIVSPS